MEEKYARYLPDVDLGREAIEVSIRKSADLVRKGISGKISGIFKSEQGKKKPLVKSDSPRGQERKSRWTEY